MASTKNINRTTLARKMLQLYFEGDASFENFVAKDLIITNATDGMLASLVDACGSLAISTKGAQLSRLSTDLNISYIASAGCGDTLLVNAECVNLGKAFAFATVEVHNKADGRLIAQGSHTMLMVNFHYDAENDEIAK
ncbi:10654_t:CDS:2, partial [Dentiscutata erythropus]